MRQVHPLFGVAFLWMLVPTACFGAYWGLPVPAVCATASGGIVDFLPVLAGVFAGIVPPAVMALYIRDNDRPIEFVLAIIAVYAVTISLFAVIFYGIGIRNGDAVATNYRDYLYFSAVTFTTLGYGDFQPCDMAKLFAAGEAVVGGFFMPFSSAVVLAYIMRREAAASQPSFPVVTTPTSANDISEPPVS